MTEATEHTLIQQALIQHLLSFGSPCFLPAFLSFFFSSYGTSAKALVAEAGVGGWGVEQADPPRTNDAGFQLEDALWMGDLRPVKKKTPEGPELGWCWQRLPLGR